MSLFRYVYRYVVISLVSQFVFFLYAWMSLCVSVLLDVLSVCVFFIPRIPFVCCLNVVGSFVMHGFHSLLFIYVFLYIVSPGIISACLSVFQSLVISSFRQFALSAFMYVLQYPFLYIPPLRSYLIYVVRSLVR